MIATASTAAAPLAKAAMPVGQYAPSTPGLLGASMALLLVLALIIALGWLLKRLPGSGFRPADGMKLVANLNLGTRERLVVVEVNGQQLLLGVTAGSVNLLHVLPEPLPPAAPTNLGQLPNFAQLLSQKLRKDS